MLEIAGFPKHFRRSHEAQFTLRPPSRLFPQRASRGAESLDEFAAREAREFPEMVDAPIAQEGDQFGGRIHFRDGDAGEKRSGMLNDERRLRMPGGERGEIGIRGHADLHAQFARGKSLHHATRPLLPVPRFHLPQIGHTQPFRCRLDEGRKRTCRFQQQRAHHLFLRACPLHEAQRRATCQRLRGHHPAPHATALRGFRHLQHTAFFRITFQDRDRLEPRLFAQA